MEKNNDFWRNMAKVIETGLVSSRDLKKEIESVIKFRQDEILSKLNLVTQEEFQVQKKIIEKMQKEITNLKANKKKTIKK